VTVNTVKFTATKLAMSGKKGILTCDADGYYEVVIGGLNVDNSAGERYPLNGAKHLFETSSVLMRRISNGNLKSEMGHPKKTPGMTNNDYINRIFSLEETKVCCHIAEVWLDEDYGKNNPNLKNPELVAIMAKIKPAGPMGPALKESLDNPKENVCFSIRALTNDYYRNGRTIRVLDSIFTWDVVTEPGIHISNKYDSPSLESLVETVITEKTLRTVAESMDTGIAVEDSKELIRDVLKTFNDEPMALYSKW